MVITNELQQKLDILNLLDKPVAQMQAVYDPELDLFLGEETKNYHNRMSQLRPEQIQAALWDINQRGDLWTVGNKQLPVINLAYRGLHMVGGDGRTFDGTNSPTAYEIACSLIMGGGSEFSDFIFTVRSKWPNVSPAIPLHLQVTPVVAEIAVKTPEQMPAASEFVLRQLPGCLNRVREIRSN